MTDELIAVLGDNVIGHLQRDRHGALTFVYEEHWRESRNAYPLSLSMPLAVKTHTHAVIESFLWNLLPDNELILERWARRFHVSARNAFALIAAVGEDCAGAVRFVKPDALDDPFDFGMGGEHLGFQSLGVQAELRLYFWVQ